MSNKHHLTCPMVISDMKRNKAIHHGKGIEHEDERVILSWIAMEDL